MKKKIVKTSLFFCLIFWSPLLLSQLAPDEDKGSYTTCNADGENETRTSADLPNAVNVGTIDDRSCYANYKESLIDGTTWGIYNITNGSNHIDTNGLQPRIERSLDRSQTTGIGSFARFTGTVRILEVGSGGRNGSYIMQAKGKHSGGGGSADPAICLYLAYPVYGKDDKGNQVQVSFDLYREQIINRGIGRTEVFLTNIKKNVPTDIVLEVGFREDPNNAAKKIHYADAVIGGKVFNWNIPEPERGLQSGIRYGAYRVWGGRAQIRWANTTYEKKEVFDEVEENEHQNLIGKVFSLQNVATGKILAHVGTVATPVVMRDSNEEINTHWSFVERGSFFNIDSQNFGILRGTGANFSEGSYAVVSTEREPPVSDSDKSWTIHHNKSDNTFRFQSNSSRFLYNGSDGKITHEKVSESDDRSKWKLILVSETLNTSHLEPLSASVNLYPNPTENKFTIAFRNVNNAHIKIYDVLGKLVFEKEVDRKNIHINKDNEFVSGIYLVKVISDDNKVFYRKLLIK